MYDGDPHCTFYTWRIESVVRICVAFWEFSLRLMWLRQLHGRLRLFGHLKHKMLIGCQLVEIWRWQGRGRKTWEVSK